MLNGIVAQLVLEFLTPDSRKKGTGVKTLSHRKVSAIISCNVVRDLIAFTAADEQFKRSAKKGHLSTRFLLHFLLLQRTHFVIVNNYFSKLMIIQRSHLLEFKVDFTLGSLQRRYNSIFCICSFSFKCLVWKWCIFLSILQQFPWKMKFGSLLTLMNNIHSSIRFISVFVHSFCVQQTVHMFLHSQQFTMSILLDAFKVEFQGFDFLFLSFKNMVCFSQSLFKPSLISVFVANSACSLYRFRHRILFGKLPCVFILAFESTETKV